MDTLLSAVASDLVGRFISFIVGKYHNQAAADKLGRLQRLLLRARTVVEEAEGRQVTNQGMLLQLKQLREAMYRGYYVLDTFKVWAVQSKRRHPVSQSFNLSKLRSDSENLEATLDDMKEFLVLLMHCPPIVRQPYSAYLFMERCMFGRHMEKEHVISFLLQPYSSLDVLPIIGPCYVGKRTLVEHVCREERVQRNFSQIVCFRSDDLNNLGSASAMDHWKLPSRSDGKSLIIVELPHDTGEAGWRRLYPSLCCAESGSKVILISRMDQVSSLGTVQALRLESLHHEEFWYFFKVLAFGSENPNDRHPELSSIAKKIATDINGSFIIANILARLLRANLNAKFWLRVLHCTRMSIQMHIRVFGKDPRENNSRTNVSCFSNYLKNGPPIFFCGSYKTGRVTERDMPRITAEDMLDGRAVPYEEMFDVLMWQSPVPPYYSYITNCCVEKSKKIDLGNGDLGNGRLKRKRRL